MKTLFYQPLCPFSRKVRIMLAELKLDYQPIIEKIWQQREEFLELNPMGQVPTFVEDRGQVICDSWVICEYLDEAYSKFSLIGENIWERAETRRIMAWFDGQFNDDVTHKLVFEKTLKRDFGLGGPDSRLIRDGSINLNQHFDYFCWLIERQRWLARDEFSLADITAAAHLSCIDYVGHIHWDKHPEIKEWYGRIKSRPSMRLLLNDKVPGIMPPAHYTNLDF